METSSATPVETVNAPDSNPLAGTAYFLWTMRGCVYGMLAIAFWQGGPAWAARLLIAFSTTPGP